MTDQLQYNTDVASLRQDLEDRLGKLDLLYQEALEEIENGEDPAYTEYDFCNAQVEKIKGLLESDQAIVKSYHEWLDNPFYLLVRGRLDRLRHKFDEGFNPDTRLNLDEEIWFFINRQEPALLSFPEASMPFIAMFDKNMGALHLLHEYGADFFASRDMSETDGIETPAYMACLNGFLEGLQFYNDVLGVSPFRNDEEAYQQLRAGLHSQDIRVYLDSLFDFSDLSGLKDPSSFLAIAEIKDIGLTLFLLERNIPLHHEFHSKIIIQFEGPLSHLQRGSDLKDYYKTLPLMRVAFSGDFERFKLYHQYGADIYQRDHRNNTVFDVLDVIQQEGLMTKGHANIVAYMEQFKKPNITTFPGKRFG